MDARLFTPAEVAARLGKSPEWWRKQAAAKRVPHSRHGRSIRFSEDDITAYLEQIQVRPDDPLKSAVTARRRAS